MKPKALLALVILLALHLFLLTHLKFTAWPEVFSYPYLKNHGFTLYRDMVHPYPPILTLTLAYLYSMFGYKLAVLEWFAWIVILLSSVCVFILARQVGKSDKCALLATAFYVLLQPFLEGNMLWFDIAIVPPVLLGTFFLLRKNIILAGIFFALAALTKQTVGLFYVAAFLWLFRETPQRSRLFVIGPLIFGVPLLVRLWQEQSVVGFWKWVVLYPATQWSKFPGYVQMSLSLHQIAVLAILSLALLIAAAKNWKQMRHPNFVLLTLLSGIGILAIYPRFSFFHFQIVLAFWAVFMGVLWARERISLAYGVLGVLLVLASLKVIIYPVVRTDWGKEARFYGSEDIKLAAQIQEVNKSNQTIFLQGLSSQYYVMSGTLPPKPWADNFSWYLEISGVQEEVLAGWAKNSPSYVVWRIPREGESLLGRYQPEKIVNYISQNYTKEQELQSGVWVWRKK